MSSINPVEHVAYRLRNATVNRYPFPHFYVEEVFPWEFYYSLLDNLPQDYKPLGSFKSRTYTDTLPEMMEGFKSSYFANAVLAIFGKEFWERFPNAGRPKLSTEWRFIRDSEDYQIGPHTDAERKVVSLLFYLPMGMDNTDVGTGIFVPQDHAQTCAGGPHYGFEGFDEVWRAPFVPNSVLGFWKNENSWHGVRKIHREIERNVLLFNIYAQK
jgi:hypothetical protein